MKGNESDAQKKRTQAAEEEVSRLQKQMVEMKAANIALEEKIIRFQSSELQSSVVSQAGKMFEKFSRNLSTRLGPPSEIEAIGDIPSSGSMDEVDRLRYDKAVLAKQVHELQRRNDETSRKKDLRIAHLSQSVNRLQNSGGNRRRELAGVETKRDISVGVSNLSSLGCQLLSKSDLLNTWLRNSITSEAKPKSKRSRSFDESIKSGSTEKIAKRNRSLELPRQTTIEQILRIIAVPKTSLNEPSLRFTTTSGPPSEPPKPSPPPEATQQFKETVDRQAQQLNGLTKELASLKAQLGDHDQRVTQVENLEHGLVKANEEKRKLQKTLDEQSATLAEVFDLQCVVQHLHLKLKNLQTEKNENEEKLRLENKEMTLKWNCASLLIEDYMSRDVVAATPPVASEEQKVQTVNVSEFGTQTIGIPLSRLATEDSMWSPESSSEAPKSFSPDELESQYRVFNKKLENVNKELQFSLSIERKLRKEFEGRLQRAVASNLDSARINLEDESSSVSELKSEITNLKENIAKLEALKKDLFGYLGISAEDPLPQKHLKISNEKNIAELLEFFVEENSRLKKDMKTLATSRTPPV